MSLSTEMQFNAGEYIVYPAHGVGRIKSIEKQEVAGMELQVFVISFDDDRMTLRLPVMKAKHAGLRRISSGTVMKKALDTLREKAEVKKVMWSKRAQQYELKINSGNPVSLAEVIRDLHRNSDQPDQSYSERQLYQAAIERFSKELAIVEEIESGEAADQLQNFLKAA